MSGGFTVKGITIELDAKSPKLDATLRKIKQETQGVDNEMMKLKRSMALNGNSFKSFNALNTMTGDKLINLKTQLAAYNQSLGVLRTKYAAAVASGGEFSAEAIGIQQQMTYLQGRIAMTEAEIQRLSASFMMCGAGTQKLYLGLGKVADMAGKAATALKPLSMLSFAGIAAATATTISFEDAWTGVTKTVEGTPEQLERVNSGLKELALNTASSYQELAGMGEIAGQMGVATDNVVGFVETVAKLGDTTNLAGEEAASALAKMANIMVEADQRTTDYYERFGSAVVDLGNNFATTENDIVQMSLRLGTAGRACGMSTQEILALSTALSSMGIEAAAGGGSMSKLMSTIDKSVHTGKDSLQMYAEVAGMTAQEFAQAWRDDAGQAFAQFVEGVGKAENIPQLLEDLEIKEIRMSNGVRALAQSTDIYKDALARSNTAWQENTALTVEADKRYGTLKSSLSQAKEALKQAGDALGKAFTPTLKGVADGIKEACKWFSKLDESTLQTIAKFMTFGAVLAPAMKGISLLASGGQKLIKTFTVANKGAGLFAHLLGLTEQAAKASTSGLSAYVRQSVETNTANQRGTTSILGLVKAFAGAHPAIAAVTGGLVALGGAFVAAKIYTEQHKKAIDAWLRSNDLVFDSERRVMETTQQSIKTNQERINGIQSIGQSYQEQKIRAEALSEAIYSLYQGEKNSAAEKAQIKTLVDQLNSVFPQLNLNYNENSGILSNNSGEALKNKDALDQLLQKQLEVARQSAIAQMMAEQEVAMKTAELQYKQSERSAERLSKRQQELTDKACEASKAYTEYSQRAGKIVTTENQLEAAMREARNAAEANRDATLEAGKAAEESAKQSLEAWQNTAMSYQTLFDDPDIISKPLSDHLQKAVAEAEKAGIQVPEALKSGIQEGSGNVQEAIEQVGALMEFKSAITRAGLSGNETIMAMANAIIESSPDITTACEQISDLIEFGNAIEKAKEKGVEVSDEFINHIKEGISQGSIDVQTAMTELSEYLKNPEAWSAAGTTNANSANQATTEELSKGGEAAKAEGDKTGNAYGVGVINGVQTGLAKITISDEVKAALQPAEAAAETAGINTSDKWGKGVAKVEERTKEGFGKAEGAVQASKVDSAAKSKANQATNQYGSALKIDGKTSTNLGQASAVFGGSSIPGQAGSLGSRATSAYSRSLDLVSPTRSQYNQVMSMIREIQAAASKPYKITVTKETKNIVTNEPSEIKRMAPSLLMSAQPAMLRAAGFAVRTNSTPVSDIVANSVSSQAGIVGAMGSRIERLSAKLDSFINSFTGMDKQLDRIANARGIVNIDGRQAGEILWKPIDNAIHRNQTITNKLQGVL